MTNTPRTDHEAIWAEAGTGDEFQCVHIDAAREIERDLEVALEALEEIAEWPRFPKGPNFSIKHLAQAALDKIKETAK